MQLNCHLFLTSDTDNSFTQFQWNDENIYVPCASSHHKVSAELSLSQFLYRSWNYIEWIPSSLLYSYAHCDSD